MSYSSGIFPVLGGLFISLLLALKQLKLLAYSTAIDCEFFSSFFSFSSLSFSVRTNRRMPTTCVLSRHKDVMLLPQRQFSRNATSAFCNATIGHQSRRPKAHLRHFRFDIFVTNCLYF